MTIEVEVPNMTHVSPLVENFVIKDEPSHIILPCAPSLATFPDVQKDRLIGLTSHGTARLIEKSRRLKAAIEE